MIAIDVFHRSFGLRPSCYRGSFTAGESSWRAPRCLSWARAVGSRDSSRPTTGASLKPHLKYFCLITISFLSCDLLCSDRVLITDGNEVHLCPDSCHSLRFPLLIALFIGCASTACPERRSFEPSVVVCQPAGVGTTWAGEKPSLLCCWPASLTTLPLKLSRAGGENHRQRIRTANDHRCGFS